MSGPAVDKEQHDLSHSKPPEESSGSSGSSKMNRSSKFKPPSISFRTASNNKNLAQRLNLKKIENKRLRDEAIKLKIRLAQYKRYIFEVKKQKNELQNIVLTANDEMNTCVVKSIGLIQRALEEIQKVGDIRASVEQIMFKENAENLSYLANTSLMSDMNRSTRNKKLLFPLKSRKKAVNMVRPMKYGFVVGNPVVSLRRLRRPVTVLEVVTENVEEVEDNDTVDNIAPTSSQRQRRTALELATEEADEDDDVMNETVIEIAPTPSGLPSPSSPEAASTSATPEPNSQTSPAVETRPPPSRRTQSSVKEQPQDSIKSKCPGPKSKKRKSLQVESAVARSLLIDKQSKKSSTPSTSSKSEHRRTHTKRSTVTPPSKPQVNNQFTISETQQIQLMTPCRVVVENLSSSPRDIQHLPTISPSQSLSPQSPVVLLDRITTRKKIRSEHQVSDSDDQDFEMVGIDEIRREDEMVNMTGIDPLDLSTLEVKEETFSPSVLVSSPSEIERELQTGNSKLVHIGQSPPINVKMAFPRKMSRNVSKVLPAIEEINEEKSDKSLKKKSVATKKFEEMPQLRVKSPSKLISPSVTKHSPEKSANSETETEFEDNDEQFSDPDYVPKNRVTVEVKSKSIPKKNRPMPLSKKLLLRKQMEIVTSEEDERGSKKRVAYENKNGFPDTLRDEFNNDSQSSVASNKYDTLDTDSSDFSYDSGSTMSPSEHKQYMTEFFSRARNEDPLEGTSKRCEPKKKTNIKNKLPCKKSLRQLKKKTYVESPDTPVKGKDMDESWRPHVLKKPKSKKKDTKKH